MAVGFPTKANWAAGDVLTASAQDDLAGTVNLLSNAGAASGTQLVSNVAGTSFGYAGNQSAGKNALINGAFDIWQRGTSFTMSGVANTYTTDRWYATLNQVTSGSLVIRQNTANKQTNDNYCLEIDQTGLVTTSTVNLTQIIETLNVTPFRGKTIVISFWASVNTGTPTLSATVIDGTNSDGFPTVSTTQDSVGAVLSTTMQKFTLTHTVQAGANSIALRFATPSAYAQKIYISQVQFELGGTPTTFTRCGGTIQSELAACQRYYEKSYEQGTAPGTATTTGWTSILFGTASTAEIRIPVRYIVTKRTNPTVTTWDNLGAINKVYKGAAGASQTSAYYASTGVQIGSTSATSASEVGFQWQADAEL